MICIKGILGHCIMRCFSLFPIRNKIVFSSFDGKNYGDNPKAIFLALQLKYGSKYEYIWLMYDETINVPNAKVVKAYSVLALFHLATAKLWIHNSRIRHWIYKRKNQFYIQTWHGNIALKKIEKDAKESLPKTYIANAKNDSKLADLIISGSRWNTLNIMNSFWYNGEIAEYGLPRSDVLFENKNRISQKVNSYLSLEKQVRVFLYCPTFRTDFTEEAYYTEFDLLYDALGESFGGDWMILVRLHPNFKDKEGRIFDNSRVLDVSDYSDVNELLIRSDIVMTDYSSIMFDCLLLGKKTFLYCTDIESYKSDRGFYFELEDLPFPLSTISINLLENIKSYDELIYDNKQKNFLKQLEFFEDGKATLKVLERLKNVLG